MCVSLSGGLNKFYKVAVAVTQLSDETTMRPLTTVPFPFVSRNATIVLRRCSATALSHAAIESIPNSPFLSIGLVTEARYECDHSTLTQLTHELTRPKIYHQKAIGVWGLMSDIFKTEEMKVLVCIKISDQ